MTVTLRKRAKNGRLYYYTLHDRQSGLFQPYTLTANWGPRPEGGREKLYAFETGLQKDKALRRLIKKRIRGGYHIFYSYARSSNYLQVFRELSANPGASAASAASAKGRRRTSGGDGDRLAR